MRSLPAATIAALLIAIPVHAEVPLHRATVVVDPVARTVTVDGETVDAGDQLLSPQGSFLTGPWPGLPAGELFRYEVTIETPAGQIGVAPGEVIARTTANGRNRVVVASEGPVDALAIFVGPYEIRERRDGERCTRTYLHPEVAMLADRYLEASASYVAHFEEHIGPAPFSCFSVVSSPLPVGLGFPGLTYVGIRVLPLPYMSGSSLAHEIAHAWWGNGVLIDASEGNWAEGLTTLLADHDLAARDDPAEARAMRERWLRDYAALAPEEDRPASAFRAKRHARSQPVGYHKVAMAFLMLRDRLGESVFTQALQTFWQEHQGTQASWTDLRQAFEEASGASLGSFFSQWISRAGAPEVAIVRARAVRTDEGVSLELEIRQGAPPYTLTMPVEVETGNGSLVREVQLDGTNERVSLEVPARPQRVRLDPDVRVFRRLPAEAVPPTLRSVAFDPRAALVVVDGDEAFRAAAIRLGRALLERDAQPVEIGSTEAKARLVIGTPAAIAALRATQRTEPAPPSANGTTRVWAARGGAGDWLYVAAEDTASLEAITRVLPHYGSRSWVVFDGSNAVAKGTWPVDPAWVKVTSDE